MPSKEKMDAWCEVLEKALLPDIQERWPCTIDKTWLYTDGELTLIPATGTDSVRLIISYVEPTFRVEVNPSPLAQIAVNTLRFDFMSREDAVAAVCVAKAYYDTVIKPNMENI